MLSSACSQGPIATGWGGAPLAAHVALAHDFSPFRFRVTRPAEETTPTARVRAMVDQHFSFVWRRSRCS